MKKVSEILPQVQATGSQQPSSREDFSNSEADEMRKLFAILSAEYPFFLPKSEEDTVNKLLMWIKLLRPYSSQQRQVALEKCLKHHKKVGGPSVGDFLEMLKTRQEHQDFQRLPAPEPTKSVARAALDNLKRILS